MKEYEIVKSRTTLRNAGTTTDRNQLRATLLAQLVRDVETLRQRMATVQADYRRKLERWRTEDVSEAVPVCALPSDMHDSQLYRLTGVFALLCEVGLAAWVFSWLGVGWWMGVVTALGITLTLHGVFLHVFDNPERPKEAIHRIRTRISLPAIFGFLIALAAGVLARYVHGALAVLLLPVFSFALWLGTLSLLVLAASLFTVAHLQGWSARHEREYRKLDAEERVTSAFLDALREEEGRSSAAHPAIEAVPKSFPRAEVAGLLVAGTLALALVSGIGCATATTSANVSHTSAESRPANAALQVYIDTSGSCVRPALMESWSAIQKELPRLVERLGITKLGIWQFDEDGWSPRRLHEMTLPSKQVATHGEIPPTEWGSFANIRQALREDSERE